MQVLFPLWPGAPVELQWGALADVAGFGFACGEASEMNGIAIEPTSVVIAFHWRRVISGLLTARREVAPPQQPEFQLHEIQVKSPSPFGEGDLDISRSKSAVAWFPGLWAASE